MKSNVRTIDHFGKRMQATAFTETTAGQVNELEKRSRELLYKFRKAWNEAEYQEWCAIQRILHRIF